MAEWSVKGGTEEDSRVSTWGIWWKMILLTGIREAGRESVREKDTGLSSGLSLTCLDDVRER